MKTLLIITILISSFQVMASDVRTNEDIEKQVNSKMLLGCVLGMLSEGVEERALFRTNVPLTSEKYNLFLERLQSIRDGGVSNFGLTGEDVAMAESLLSEADECIEDRSYRQAFECKCLAYRNELLGGEDSSVSCEDPCGG